MNFIKERALRLHKLRWEEYKKGTIHYITDNDMNEVSRGRRAFPLMHEVGLVAEESHEKSPNKGKYLSLVSFWEVVQVLHHTI